MKSLPITRRRTFSFVFFQVAFLGSPGNRILIPVVCTG
jgi:hypothetical protein